MSFLLTIASFCAVTYYVYSPLYWICRTDKWIFPVGLSGFAALFLILISAGVHGFWLKKKRSKRMLALLIVDFLVFVVTILNSLFVLFGSTLGSVVYMIFAIDWCTGKL